jgi:hypothetical protein
MAENDDVPKDPMSFAEWCFPKLLHSVEKGGPFTHCLECGMDLTTDASAHFIEKARRGPETIFEFASCLECAEQRFASYSQESRRWIEVFFAERVDPDRAQNLRKRFGGDVRAWLAYCVTCGRPIADCGEYQVHALCRGRRLIRGDFPWCICGDCVEALAQGFSNETIGEIDRWTREHLAPPAGYLDLLHDRWIVL